VRGGKWWKEFIRISELNQDPQSYVNLLTMLLQFSFTAHQLIAFGYQLLSCLFQLTLQLLIYHFPLANFFERFLLIHLNLVPGNNLSSLIKRSVQPDT
jgi:hypothetical protein